MDNNPSMQPLNVSEAPYSQEPLYPTPFIYQQLDTQGLRSIFIGSLFVFFAFRIAGFDILPDFVGYLMILSGLGKMEQYSKYFKHAKIFAVFQLIFSLRDIVKADEVSSGIPILPDWFYVFNIIISFAVLIVQIGSILCISRGVTEISRMTEYHPFFKYGEKIYIIKVVGYISNFLWMALTPILIGVYENLEFLVVTVVGIAMISEIVYLIFLRSAYKQMFGLPIIKTDMSKATRTDNLVFKGTIIAIVASIAFMFGFLIFSNEYINQKFIFNPNTFPKTLKQRLDIDYRRFEKNLSISTSYYLNGKTDYSQETRLDDDDETVKELIEYVDKILNEDNNRDMYISSSDKSVFEYIFGNNITYYGNTIQFGGHSNIPWGSENADYYVVSIHTPKGTFDIRVCNEERWININERSFSISDELRGEFIHYIKYNIINELE